MTDNNLPDISVGDFAMDILKSMATKPGSLKPTLKESTLESANTPDISHIKVSDDYVSMVTEGKKPAPKLKSNPIQENNKQKNLDDLLESLSLVVKQATKILKEMCDAGASPGQSTTGNLGVGNRIKNKVTKLKFKRSRK